MGRRPHYPYKTLVTRSAKLGTGVALLPGNPRELGAEAFFAESSQFSHPNPLPETTVPGLQSDLFFGKGVWGMGRRPHYPYKTLVTRSAKLGCGVALFPGNPRELGAEAFFAESS